jgi:hypothetical protein
MSEEFNNTDSTFNTSKEIEKKNSSFESGNNVILNSYINQKTETNEFKEPDHEIKWVDNIQTCYHFKQDIERVWLIIRSFDILMLISNPDDYPCVIIKGQDTWKEGNIFKGNSYGLFPFVGKVNKTVNFPEMKKIEWLFNVKDNDYFMLTIELFKVNEDKTTVALREFKFEKKQLKLEFTQRLKNINEITIFNKIEKILEKEPINLLRYESGIISGQMEDIWNFILDFNNLIAIAPNNNYLPNINFKELKIGQKVTASVFFNDEIRTFDITLKCKEERKGWNKWIMGCEVSGGAPKKVPKHIVLFQLTKINNNESQLTLLTKFNEPIDNDEFKKLSDRKKYVLNSIKDYFENFYTPSSSPNSSK